jgi:TRAP-type uncharacterized transport system fused permease subunit
VFVVDTGLILQGGVASVLISLVRAVVGIWLIVAGLQGYLQGLGKLTHPLARAGLLATGLAIAFSGIYL